MSDRDFATRLAREHYENFPVGSRLVPPRFRRHVHRIYAFARVADDLADEARDLQGLLAWREATRRALGGKRDVPRLLADLAQTVAEFSLPEHLLFDLLDAFERDLRQSRYEDLADLESYCRQSADPIGRLLLHMLDRATPENLALSDRICTALQILNHLQDVKGDFEQRDRIYLPQDRLRAHGVREADFRASRCGPGLRSCIHELAEFCDDGFRHGSALPRRIGGRFALELRAILAGARLVLDRLRRADYDVFRRRPRIRKEDAPELLVRTLIPWRGRPDSTKGIHPK